MPSRSKKSPRSSSAAGDGRPTGTAPGSLPSRQDILDYIAHSPRKVGKREIARAFGLRGPAKLALKQRLKEMAEEGLISNPRKRIHKPGQLPSTTVIEITGTDRYGEPIGVPVRWDETTEGPLPQLVVTGGTGKGRQTAAPGPGDRVLVRVSPVDGEIVDGIAWQARVIKNLGPRRAPQTHVGIFHADTEGRGGRLEPVDRKAMKSWVVSEGDRAGAQDGELVEFEAVARRRGYGPSLARITKRLGNPRDERQISLIAIHRHDLPTDFPDSVEAELRALPAVSMEGRTDLRKTPFITIDPPDARDHDDAIFAEADPDPDNAGGHIVWVAIADVAHYVRPHSALDREALKRGNSVYFPDRVVPMLPERLSADLCSLKAGEDRPCLAVRMTFDRQGRKRDHRFLRAMMRNHAALSYERAQAAMDGHPDAQTAPLLEKVLKPLWAAYHALAQARDARAPLNLELPERKIVLGDDGHVSHITTPPRLDAHRLVEEFMIQANVAAAEALEAKRSPLIYRIHDTPAAEKITALSEFLASLELKLPRQGVLLPQHFNRILDQARGQEFQELVNETILRSQSQAEYSPQNRGHFGLNLRRYAHFTSPIRRYADLVVHRALISALKLGDGKDGLPPGDVEKLGQIAQGISDAERRAMMAERETVDRLIAHFLADRIGSTFSGRISGISRAGLFVRLSDTGADGFIPARSIGHEYFYHDERAHALVGEESGETFRLGDVVDVELVEAIPAAGALRFELLSRGRVTTPPRRRPRAPRPAPRRRGRGRRR